MSKLTSRKQEMFGDYIIRRTIGKGTFSKVKLGINSKNNKRVAIKILEKSKIKEKEDLERTIREMAILKNFNHPNVIQTYEIHETKESYLIIMEYCEGGELFNYIVKNDNLSEEESSFFFYQIVNGLEYIHSKGIIHRDLKPENLLLTSNHKLKIIDFGLSNFFNGKKLLSTPCGSPCYAAPEMVSGEKYNGFYSDIWALGIILFAMTCGYLPFEDKDNDVLFQKIINCDIEFPDFLSFICKDLIIKILNTEPEERIKIKDIKKHKFYLMGKKIYEDKFKYENESFNIENYFSNVINSNNGNNINNNINNSNNNNFNSKNNKNNNTITHHIPTKPILTEYNLELNGYNLYNDYFKNGKIMLKNKPMKIKKRRRFNDLNNDIKFLFPNHQLVNSQNISINTSNANRSKMNSLISDYEISDYAKTITSNNKINKELNLFKLNLHKRTDKNNIFRPHHQYLLNQNINTNNPKRINKSFFNMIPLSFNSPTTEKITQRIINNQTISAESQRKNFSLPSIYRKEKRLNIHLANKYPLRVTDNLLNKEMLKFNLERENNV